MAQIGDVRKIPCREIFSAGDSCLYGPCALILNCMEYVEDWSVSSFQEPFLRTLLDAVKIFVSGIKKSTFTSSIFLIPLPFHTTFCFWSRLPGGFLSALKNTKNRRFQRNRRRNVVAGTGLEPAASGLWEIGGGFLRKISSYFRHFSSIYDAISYLGFLSSHTHTK